jgi:hypothetical protein
VAANAGVYFSPTGTWTELDTTPAVSARTARVSPISIDDVIHSIERYEKKNDAVISKYMY